MADAFDPPTGDAAALARAAGRFGTVSGQLHSDSGGVDKAVTGAKATWTGTRSKTFITAAFGMQTELDAVVKVTGTVADLLTAYARKWSRTTDELADLRRRHDALG